MRPLLVLALAAALAVPLAGCLAAAAPQATALQHRDAADAVAKAWSPNATLVSVAGLEGTAPLVRWITGWVAGQDDLAGATNDTQVGDGRAQAWVYRYVSTERSQAFVVVIDEHGNLASSRAEARRGDDVLLPDGLLDSDAALRQARAANQAIREGADRTKYGVLSVLRAESERPVWLVLGGGHDATGGALGFVKLDAKTGETLQSFGGFGST